MNGIEFLNSNVDLPSPPKHGTAPKQKTAFDAFTGTVFEGMRNLGLGIQKRVGLNRSDFAENLAQENFGRIFQDTAYSRFQSYEEALDVYRREAATSSSPEHQKIAENMFSLPIWDLAYETLGPYFLNRYSHNAAEGFADNFVRDTETIKDNLRAEIGQGVLHTTGLKLTAYTSQFDSHRNGNYPYLAGIRSIDGREVRVLRHGVPVREWLDPSAISQSAPSAAEEVKEPKTLRNSGVSEEYRAFLSSCRSNHRKVLYNCLLNPNNREGDEKPRMEALFKLGLDPEYKDTFHFMKMPADGPIAKACKNEGNLESYKQLIETSIEKLRGWSDEDLESWEAISKKDLTGFVPGSLNVKNVILEKYSPILELSYSAVLSAYDRAGGKDFSIGEQSLLLKEKKQAFMMLFCTLLKMSLIKELEITDYNNTCKDAIDRGSIHLVCDFLWDSFLTNDLKRSEDNLRVHAAWPATMAKTQAILEDRAEWITSFARFIEKASEDGELKDFIFSFCKKNGFVPNRPVNFLNSYKDPSYIRHVISKTPKDFSFLRKKIEIPQKFDKTSLFNLQRNIRDYLIEILPQLLEKCHYHNLPLSLCSQETVADINITNTHSSMLGEMGFFSENLREFIGGPVFSISIEGQKLGEVEVACRWEVNEASLTQDRPFINFSLVSRLKSKAEDFELVEGSQIVPIDLSSSGFIDRAQQRKERIQQAIIDRESMPADGFSLQNLQEEDPDASGISNLEEMVFVHDPVLATAAPRSIKKPSRMRRDIVLLGIGAVLGASGSKIFRWAQSFFVFTKSKTPTSSSSLQLALNQTGNVSGPSYQEKFSFYPYELFKKWQSFDCIKNISNNSHLDPKSRAIALIPIGNSSESQKKKNESVSREEMVESLLTQNPIIEPSIILPIVELTVSTGNFPVNPGSIPQMPDSADQSAPIVEPAGFSTSFKVGAGLVIGGAMAYGAIKAYEYFRAKNRKVQNVSPSKKESEKLKVS